MKTNTSRSGANEVEADVQLQQHIPQTLHAACGVDPKKKESITGEHREALEHEVIDTHDGAEKNGTCPVKAHGLAGQFDPFHDPYLADPYPFFEETRAATPVFYSADLDYWVVTRYHDIRHIFLTPKLFSAVNTL